MATSVVGSLVSTGGDLDFGENDSLTYGLTASDAIPDGMMVGIKVMVTHPREILVAQAGRLVLGPGEAGEVNFRLAPGARDLLEAFMEEQAKTPKVKICAVCVETTDAEALLEQLRESSFWRYVPGVESCVAHVLVTADAYQLVPPPGYDEVVNDTGAFSDAPPSTGFIASSAQSFVTVSDGVSHSVRPNTLVSGIRGRPSVVALTNASKETVSFIVRPDAGLTADPPWAELPGGATQTVDLYFSTRAIAPTKVVVWSAEEALGDRIASIIEWERLGDRGTLGTLELYTIGYSGPSRRPLPSSATATATATPTGVPAATTSAGGMAFSSTGVPIPARAVGTGVRASELNVVSADGPTFSVRPGQVIDFATPTEEQSIYIKETSGVAGLAFKIKVTHPRHFVVKPNAGVIDAGDTVVCRILRSPSSPPMVKVPKFLCQIIGLAEESETTEADVREVSWWRSRDGVSSIKILTQGLIPDE